MPPLSIPSLQGGETYLSLPGGPEGLQAITPKARGDMAMKEIVFSDAEQQQIEAIVIDKDKEEALKYLAGLVDRFKGHPGHACGPKPAK